MAKKVEKRCAEAYRKMNAIIQFAKEMGYETYQEDYHAYDDDRPCHSIEINKYDSEGNPYSWVWYTDTWEEME